MEQQTRFKCPACDITAHSIVMLKRIEVINRKIFEEPELPEACLTLYRCDYGNRWVFLDIDGKEVT